MITAARKQQIIELCQALVREQSYSGQEQEVAKVIQQYATEQGVVVEVDRLGNVILTVSGNAEGPTILFDGHIDTVTVNENNWTVSPFAGEVKDGKIFGRGTTDMKGAVSAMILAALYLKEDTNGQFCGKVVVSCSVHEECFEGIATREVSKLVKPDFVVIGEATDLQLNRGQRGRAEIVVKTYGKSAHSSNPSKGINAVYQMTTLLNEIYKLPVSEHDILGKGILELTDIQSSPYPGASVVPSECKVTFDRRLLVGETEEQVLAPIQEIIARLEANDPTFKATVEYAYGQELCYTGAMIEEKRYFPAWLYEETESFVAEPLKALQAAGFNTELSHYSFCTNASHFAGEAKIPTIGFGPSLESLAHVDDEYIKIEDLVQATHGYYIIAQSLLALQPEKERVLHV